MYTNNIFEIKTKAQFDRLALETFRFQADRCEVYTSYLQLLGIEPTHITSVEKIPFLPIELFKTHTVYCGDHPAQQIFNSSATSGTTPSRHHVAHLSIYEESFSRTFRLLFGDPQQYTILALLPSYIERHESSLVYMVSSLMQQSGATENGFYLYNFGELHTHLSTLRHNNTRTLLFGVSFALLDFAEKYPIDFPDLEIIETGGMKGRGIERSRTELFQRIGKGFGTSRISSEYGMAELLSQGYAKETERFRTPPWMRVIIRDLHDPFRLLPHQERGGINIIDLSNRYSCSFIETQDLGLLHPDHTFEVLGRIPYSELRGCNLLFS
ncbi:MAG: acyltransferase [Prevotellaceae bacterium]|jgi:phenylacetate-coenzyme A ligase PaaK-like adenylate-forming protein|nr:acyltransferase [Prevotellaceae bacterium]